MKKVGSFCVTVLVSLSLFGTSALACGSKQDTSTTKDQLEYSSEELTEQYATGYVLGDESSVDLSYAPQERKNPENALGVFDGEETGTAGNDKFFSTAFYDQSTFTFNFEDADTELYNVKEDGDIRFSEVTYEGYWYVEGVKVYLKDAYIKNGDKLEKYTGDDDGLGYFAGIVWNRIGYERLTDETRLAYETAVVADRDYADPTVETTGNITVTNFNLPDEVVKASAITLVDMYGNIIENEGAYGYTSMPGGFDLDGIRVWVKEVSSSSSETEDKDDCNHKQHCCHFKETHHDYRWNFDKLFHCGDAFKIKCH